MQIFLISLLIPFTAFIFEIYPRIANRKVGVDIWTHLLYLREYKKQNGIPKKITDGFLVPGEYDYPPIFITILSKFPVRLVEKYEFIFSPLFDCLHLIIIFFLSYFLTQNIYISLLTQLLYTLTPIIILENSSATPRSLGYTLFTGVFFSLFYYLLDGNYYLLLLAIFLGSLIFLSHRFTTQGFLFFAIVFSIIDLSPIYIITFSLSFLIALVLSKGFYLKVLEGHIGNLKFWRDNISSRFFHQVKGDYKTHKSSDFVFRLYNEFISIPPIVLTVTNPWIPFVFLSFLYNLYNQSFYLHLFNWVLVSYILALLTIWIKPLRFLGEGQRYLELSAFPTAFLAARLLFSIPQGSLSPLVYSLYTVVGVAAFVTIVVIQRKAIIKDKLRTLTPELEKMYSYLLTLKNKPRLLCIPHQITTNTIYHTNCQVFVNADYKNISKISDVYPYLKLPIKQIMKKNNLEAILLNEDYATIKDLKINKSLEVKRFGNYVLLKNL